MRFMLPQRWVLIDRFLHWKLCNKTFLVVERRQGVETNTVEFEAPEFLACLAVLLYIL